MLHSGNWEKCKECPNRYTCLTNLDARKSNERIICPVVYVDELVSCMVVYDTIAFIDSDNICYKIKPNELLKIMRNPTKPMIPKLARKYYYLTVEE